MNSNDNEHKFLVMHMNINNLPIRDCNMCPKINVYFKKIAKSSCP